MSDAGGAGPEWPGSGLMCQFMLAAARQFLSADVSGVAADTPRSGGITPEQLAGLFALPGSLGATPGTGDAIAGRLAAEFLGQASMLAMASGFRYWRRLMRLADQHQSLAGRLGVSAVQAVSEPEQRLLLEELRTLAREVGDAASQEGRRFGLEMERLGLSLGTPPDVPSFDAPHRHARAKA